MNYLLGDDLALISGEHAFLLVAKALARFPLCIETASGEVCQGVDPTDLIVVSAPEGGPVEPGMMLVELVRRYRMPLLVLPKGHPGSRRLSWVVSVGPLIETNCEIRRGTHPGQTVICSHGELSGIILKGTADGFSLSGLPAGVSVRNLPQKPLNGIV
ncbi:MAG TPA: alpha/beta hydrolase [Methanoregula sp.]|nr:alpha/beta hydrolase [Methanoregula sp.]